MAKVHTKTTTSRATKTPAGKKTNLKTTARRNKSETVIELALRMLRRKNGVSVAELVEATGWQDHSIRALLSATIRKKLGLPLVTTKTPNGRSSRYHIAALKPAKE